MSAVVSVILPCYKGESFVEKTIDSCLAQDADLELIIVDDASPDNCGEIAEGFAKRDKRVSVVRHETNKGVAEAFNTGFNEANGQYLFRLAQDDILRDGALAAMGEFLDSNPDVAMVYADMEMIDDSGDVKGSFRTAPTGSALKVGSGIGLCWMFRRAVWEAGYRFDSRYDQIEDFEFWMRASKEFKVAKLEAPPLLQFRQHEGMGSAQHAARMELLTAEVIATHTDSPSVARKAVAEASFNASYIERQAGNRSEAIRLAAAAIKNGPLQARYYRNLIGALLGR